MSYLAFPHTINMRLSLLLALLVPAVLAGAAIGRWQALLVAFFWPLAGLLPERCITTVDQPFVHESICSSTSYTDQGPAVIVVAVCLIAGVLIRRGLNHRRGPARNHELAVAPPATGWQPPG